MIRSMTGYGEAVGPTASGPLRVEVRTVNHRYLNVNTRLPAALVRWEGEIREWLRGALARGHVNLTARREIDGAGAAGLAYRLDDEKVASYLGLFTELSSRFGIPGTPDLSLLARFSDIIVRREEDESPAEVGPEELRPIVEAAARRAVEMREEEGKRLEIDLRDRLAAIEASLAQIERLAPARLVAERARLQAAIAELLGKQTLDEWRIAHEVAVLAERWDLNEELVRFRSHTELFSDLLASDEPIGKRLSFLVQEMNREANTLGSKANSAPIAHLVVAVKDELERIREQVENVE